MKQIFNKLFLASVLMGGTLSLVMLGGCSKSKHELHPTEVTFNHADSLIMDAYQAYDDSATLGLADSLENLGELSHTRAEYYRGRAYKNLFERDKAIECYKNVIDGITDADYWCYEKAGVSLGKQLTNVGEFEELLKVIIPIVTYLDSVGYTDKEAQVTMRTMIGTGSLRLGNPKQAKECFDRVGKECKEWLDTDTTHQALANVIDIYNQIATFYQNEGMYKESQPWVELHKELLPDYQRYFSDLPEDMVQRHIISSIFNRLSIADEQGDSLEAEKIIKEFKSSDASKSMFGRIYMANYLLTHQRYAETADNLTILDQFIQEGHMEMTLDNLILYTNKLLANLEAGRKDTALYVAKQVADNYAEALHKQRENDAAQLATIYDTQGKERQIAQQQAELQQQRIIGLIVAIILLTIFFVIYTLLRRRAAKRMAEMRAKQERIESELQIARNIQMSMVPSQFPDYEGLDMSASMTPAKEVGGDLYGYVLIGDMLYFAVGDVSGKGVPASLFMAQATRLFRTLATQKLMPAEICTRMNEALSGEDNESGMFVTFFLGLIDLKTGHLSFCNAGHNPPVMDEKDFIEMTPNAPIGLWPEMEFEGEEIENVKGHSLFIYTDGLNEAENLEQEQFGDDHLLDVLRSQQFDNTQQEIDYLKAEVEKHRNGAEPNDDLTMMCIRLQK